MLTETSKFATQCQQSPVIVGTSKSVVFMASRGQRHCRSRPYALCCASKLTLSKKMYGDNGQFVFNGVSLFVEMCTIICLIY